MEEGVECQVELVNGCKSVVVVTRSTEDETENCIDVFRSLIRCVMSTKTEFCDPIRPDFFLLDSTDEADYLNEDNLFTMYEVERALTNPEKRGMILSVTGNKCMERSRLLCMRKLTHWDSFFPINFASVCRHLDEVEPENLYYLGLELKVLVKSLDEIFDDSHNDSNARRQKLVRKWLRSSLDPPCWWQVMQALESQLVSRRDLAGHIKESFGKGYSL
jgi:hypothetical protein